MSIMGTVGSLLEKYYSPTSGSNPIGFADWWESAIGGGGGNWGSWADWSGTDNSWWDQLAPAKEDGGWSMGTWWPTIAAIIGTVASKTGGGSSTSSGSSSNKSTASPTSQQNFLDTLGKIIGVLGPSLGLSALGGWLGGQQSEEEKKYLEQLFTNAKRSAELAEVSAGRSQDYSKTGMNWLNQAGTFFSQQMKQPGMGIKEPSQEWVDTLTSPDRRALADSYAASRNARASMTPRSGATAAFNAQLPFQLAGQMSDLTVKTADSERSWMRNQATDSAKQMGTMGGSLIQSGNTAMNTAGNMLSSGESAIRSLLDAERARQQRAANAGYSTVQSVLPYLKDFGDLLGGIFSGGSKTTTTSTGSAPKPSVSGGSGKGYERPKSSSGLWLYGGG